MLPVVCVILFTGSGGLWSRWGWISGSWSGRGVLGQEVQVAHRLGGGQVTGASGSSWSWGWVGGFKWSIVNGGQVDPPPPPPPKLCVKGTGAVVGISS